MKRWHEERELMLRRWRMEVAKHEGGLTEAMAPVPPTGEEKCHCYRGMGTMRKQRPYGCHRARCGLCKPHKRWPAHTRGRDKRKSIEDSSEW